MKIPMIEYLSLIAVDDETRKKIPDEVSELSVPGTHFDGQPHIHHNTRKQKHAQMCTIINDENHNDTFPFIQ